MLIKKSTYVPLFAGLLWASSLSFADTGSGTEAQPDAQSPGTADSPVNPRRAETAAESLAAVISETLRDAPERARTAILRYTDVDLEEWHYQRTRVSKDGRLTERHDPTLPGAEHWQLVSIDDREPTPDELEDFNADRADHSEDDQKARAERIVSAIIPGSMSLKVKDAIGERYSYDLQSPDGKREKTYEKLTGDLLVEDSEDGPWVSRVSIWNRDTLRPILGVRIDEARMDFEFSLEQGYVLPVAVTAQWTGEILMLKALENRIEFTLSDFQRVSPKALERSTGP